jgi:uncharacterized protein
MKCPTCPDTTLVMADRSGIEIDYCPVCRGVWLDRGELDKIIERASATVPAAAPALPLAPRPRYDDDRYGGERRYDDRNYSNDSYPSKKKKKKSMLSEIFDF